MTGFAFIQTTLVVCMHIVGLSMLLATWRLLRGPTVPDRILALDTLSVTANKALLAHHGVQLAKLAQKRGTTIFFEAAAAGGIPIMARTLGIALSGAVSQ